MPERISPSPSIFAQICFVFSLLMSMVSYAADRPAVNRPMPGNAKMGEISSSANRTIEIDGKVRQLTAGAQIRNQQNTLIQPQTLVSVLNGPLADVDVPILYTENNQGQIHRIWILTSEETQNYSSDTPPPTVATPGIPTPSN